MRRVFLPVYFMQPVVLHSAWVAFPGYRPSVMVATARRANPRNNSKRLSPLITGMVIKLPRSPSTPRTTAIHQVVFFGADRFRFIVILLVCK